MTIRVLRLNGDALLINGNRLVFGTDAPVAQPPRGDDAFRTSGQREKFWSVKAEEWLDEQLTEAREAVQEGEKAEFAKTVAPKVTVALMQWPEMAPAINAIGKIADAMRTQGPDPEIWSLIAAAELQRQEYERQRRLWRKRRDEDALMRIMGWQ